jgi:hypothetical protein
MNGQLYDRNFQGRVIMCMEFSRQGSENYSGFPREVVISAWKFQGIGSENPPSSTGGYRNFQGRVIMCMEFSRQGSENYSGFPGEVVISGWKFQGMGSEKPPFLNRGGADINWNSPI